MVILCILCVQINLLDFAILPKEILLPHNSFICQLGWETYNINCRLLYYPYFTELNSFRRRKMLIGTFFRPMRYWAIFLIELMIWLQVALNILAWLAETTLWHRLLEKLWLLIYSVFVRISSSSSTNLICNILFMLDVFTILNVLGLRRF